MGNITSCHLVLNVQNMVRIWSMLLLICYLVACSVKDLKKCIKWVFLLLNQRMYLTWAEKKKGHLFFQITLGNEAKVQQWFRKHSLKTGTLHNSLMKYSVYIGAFGGHDFQTTTKTPQNILSKRNTKSCVCFILSTDGTQKYLGFIFS